MKYLKHIPLKGAHNVRDLGGYPTKDGRVTRWGMLYRSDALAELTDEDWSVLEARNIKTILDLRSQGEAAAAKIRPPEGVRYYQFSLMNTLDQMGQNRTRESIIESMKLDYEKTLFGNFPCCAEIFHTILRRMEDGAILFLCSAGKDRTGIVAALALYLCNVAREDIIADYMVSSTYNANGINQKLANLPDAMLKMLPDMDLLWECLDSKPGTIAKLLDAFEVRGIREHLANVGFSAEHQSAFRMCFTEAIDE